ncbi:MAG TPA: type II toxin-antitoxin system RelE/ParE family toxin [Candidatus Bacteroides intestinavium]|uniref:Type II toxin-antitoxin system RelE/ParE family toxin n=1 Tax=Candidatus Bacteroides intestinavium TaxID=2838469 RepID=A0A9D2KTQ9_9BACE|nr:type II toxin-antitoxin system RelE/ParE family toxin [Candidatus Bacteroides intestinavium]
MVKNISYTAEFTAEFKRLKKKYRSLEDDFLQLLKSLSENPIQGNSLPLQMRKVRMGIKSKGKGTRGGARVIIRYSIVDDILRFIYIYDKSEMGNVSTDFLSAILKEVDN